LGDNLNLRLACRIEQGFIQRTFTHVLKQPLSFFSKRSSAALSKQINQSEEVSAIVDGFSQQILPELLSLAGILIIMFTQNAHLTLISLIVIPFYLFIAWRSANRLEVGLSEYYDRWEEVSTRMQDALGGIKTVKLSGAEEKEVAQFTGISNDAYAEYITRNKLANKYVFWENVLTKLATALVLGYGGYLTLQHQLTPGDVVMFVAYLDRLYEPIDSLASLWVSMQQNVASIARAFKLLHSGTEEKKGKPIVVNHGLIEFEQVHFGYARDKEILKGLSFSIQPGKVTALVGTSGAGKTTTVDLIMKLYDTYHGTIRIDGTDIKHADAASLRAQIGMVAADGAIFRGTLADNIRYKRTDASDEEVKAAAEAAGLKTTLSRLPKGLRTEVGESGFGLSVGERQRIQIARVLVAKPKILIMDEATANLDYATEAEIKKTVDEIRKENTVVVIAHRYSMVQDADHVIVLTGGEVAEEGTPAELIKRGDWFAKFAQAAHDVS
jgi:ABC-type multidrug transport system fused ATPase/permease subunit